MSQNESTNQHEKRVYPNILLGRDSIFQNFLIHDVTHGVIAGTVYKQKTKNGEIIEDKDHPPLIAVTSAAAINSINRIVSSIGATLPLKAEMGKKTNNLYLLTSDMFRSSNAEQVVFSLSANSAIYYKRQPKPEKTEITVDIDTAFAVDRMFQSFIWFGGKSNLFALSIQGRASKRLIFPNLGSSEDLKIGDFNSHGTAFNQLRAIWPELDIHSGKNESEGSYITINKKFTMPDNVKYIQLDRFNAETCQDGSANERRNIVTMIPFAEEM